MSPLNIMLESLVRFPNSLDHQVMLVLPTACIRGLAHISFSPGANLLWKRLRALSTDSEDTLDSLGSLGTSPLGVARMEDKKLEAQ